MMKFHSRTEKDVPQPVRLVARQIYDKQCDKHDREYDTPVASLLPLHARTASFRVRLSLIIRWREMLHSPRDGEEKSIRYLRFPRSSNEFTEKSIYWLDMQNEKFNKGARCKYTYTQESDDRYCNLLTD